MTGCLFVIYKMKFRENQLENQLSHVGFKQKKIAYLVAVILPMMIEGPLAFAACNGSVTSPNSNAVSILCNNDGATTVGNLTVNDSTTYVDTTNAGSTSYVSGGSKTLVQFDGQGRVLTVNQGGVLSNFRNVNGNRIAVVMGQPTQNAGASTTFTTTPVAGATVVSISGTPASTWVGQSLVVGRYSAADGGDFIAGTAYKITAVDTVNKTVTLETALSADFAPGDSTLPFVYGVVSNYGAGVTKRFTGEAADIFGSRHFYNNVVDNSGTISARIQASELNSTATGDAPTPFTSAAYGIRTSVAGDYLIDNKVTGEISVTTAARGTMIAVEAGGNVTRMDIRNAGLISVQQTQTISPTVISATGNPSATSNGFAYNAATLNQGNAIQTQEEVEEFNLLNESTGVIRTRGDYTGSIYLRAAEKVIVNNGLIEHLSTAGGTNYTKGFAIGAVSDGGEIRTLDLTNNGTINGDILVVNGNALRYSLLSTLGSGTGGSFSLVNGINDRLNINNQFGQSDSSITNAGTVNGNLYLSNGTHELTNKLGATWTGDIDVDQRNTLCGQSSSITAGCGGGDVGKNTVQTAVVETVSVNGSRSQTFNVYNLTTTTPGTFKADKTGLTITSTATNPTSLSASAASSIVTGSTFTGIFTTVGTKSFTFENEGTFVGNLTVRTASTNLLGSLVESSVTLIPTITGAGGATANAASADGVAGLGNTFNVISTAGGSVNNITIKPKVADGVTVVDGQYYKLANTFQINSSNVAAGATTLPTVEASNSLVSWTASVNSNNALVLESEVADASNVAGVSGNSAKALNALASANNSLLGTLANLDGDAKVAKAAETLVPEVNGASVNAAQRSFGSAMQLISNRNSAAQTNYLANLSGQRGVSTGDDPQLTGFWLQAIGYNADQNRRKGVDGYDVAAYGAALGVDRIINVDNNLRVGGAFTYTNSKVEADGTNNGDTVAVNSYIGSVYASVNMGDWYLNGSVVAGQHQYDSRRQVVNATVKGDYEAKQVGVFMDAGLPINTRLGTLIPVASAAYNYLDIDRYQERGTGGLNVSGNEVHSFRTGLGARMLFPVYKNNSFVELRGVWFHEFADNRFDTTARFTTGGSSFRTNGVSQARDSANVGMSVKLNGDANAWMQQSLLLTYDAEVKDQFLSHTGSVQLRFDF